MKTSAYLEAEPEKPSKGLPADDPFFRAHQTSSGTAAEKEPVQEAAEQQTNLVTKLIRFITFVDLPIKKKFVLFSLGVLFWFVVMFTISIGASVDINNKTETIVDHIIPLDRTIQKITRKLYSLNSAIADIRNFTNIYAVEQKIDASKAELQDMRLFIASLLHGGQIVDISRDVNRLIDSYTVAPADTIVNAKPFILDLQQLIEQSKASLNEIETLKKNSMNSPLFDDSGLVTKLAEYRELLATAIARANDFSVQLSKLYEINSDKIEGATKITFYTFITVLILATVLLIIFTISISNSITQPVRAIIEEICSLGAGKVDLSRKIAVRSKDEIGQLSADFNNLTREIYDIVTFKKVIEEDHTLEDVYARMGKAFTEKCGLHEFTIYEVSRSQNKMKPVYPITLNDRDLYCNEEILSDCDLCKVKKTGHSISSVTYSEICREFKPGLEKVHLCLPMIVGGKTGGVVQFRLDKDTFVLDNSDKRLFKAEQYIKESLSVIEAKRLTNTLRESALKDPLTGLYNRRFLQEYTETLVSGVLRRNKNVGLIMCDLDYFKQVNDTHGHNVGDSLLKETAQNILRCVRAADLVIRFGGEEFLVVLLDTREGDAAKVAEKIRETFESTKFKIPDGTLKKTISLGISEFPVDTESLWQAIKFADVALYKAKEAGRNRAVRFNKEMWAGEEF